MQAALSRRAGASAMTATTTTTSKPTSSRPLATPPSSSSSSPGSASGGTPRPSLLRGGRGAALAGVVAAAGLFSWLTGGGDKKKEGKYDDILSAARSAKPKCPPSAPPPEGMEQLALASGCFWGSQLAADRTDGVAQSWVGYTQGSDPEPTYESVCSAWGKQPHTEAVLIHYKKGSADLELILDEYLANFDPTTRNRQGGDRGPQYRSGIYYYTQEQRAVAERKLAEADARARAGEGVTRSGRRWEGGSVVVELKEGGPFYIAESYHQRYLERGGRFGRSQSAAKGEKAPIRCYG